ncbi:MAG: hypothetical protein WD904_01300 [Dehalococcoidia bacterium]
MKRFMIIGGLVAALAVGAVAVVGAGAQEGTPTPDASDSADEQSRVEHYLEVLAGNLGISVEELEAALRQSELDLLDEKVADGTLTEEEAAEIREKIESGEAPYFPPFIGGYHHGPIHRIVVGVVEAAADVFDMDVADLHEQLREGNSLAAVATAQGVDVEQFKTDLLAAIQAKIDEKVAGGALTEEQGNNLYERLSGNIDDIVEKTPGDGHFGPGGPHRPFGSGFFFQEDADEPADAETSATTTLF